MCDQQYLYLFTRHDVHHPRVGCRDSYCACLAQKLILYEIHGHDYLDAVRWAWLQDELSRGQANNQLMSIAAHIPLAVVPIGSEMEWWNEPNIKPEYQNNPNYLTAGGSGKIPVPSMDPTRPQSDDPNAIDPTIQYVDLSTAPKPVPVHGSYNAELFVQLSPHIINVLKARFK